MPDAGNNSTKSRLSSFIDGCSQLTEIYAVQPLEYTNIMGEWWQRINDIIYTLGLTSTEEDVVNIAWTVPVPGRKRSPFYEEELSTKTEDGSSVSESSRVSHVARSGTRNASTNARASKAHKYGFIQSVDALFQRNIDTLGSIYEYFWNQTHDPATGDLLPSASIKEPVNLAEMLFGKSDIEDSLITSLFEDATRNLTGDDRGLVNSMKHIIENIIGSAFYDWLDSMDADTSTGLGGLEKFFFGQNEDGSPLGADAYALVLDKMTTGGIATETVKIINTFGEDFYNWLNNPAKVCSIASSNTVYHLYKRTNGTWARINASTEYSYKGKTTIRYTLESPEYGSAHAPMLFSSSMSSGSMSYKENPEASIAIALVYGDLAVNTTELALKKEFINYVINGTATLSAPINALVPSPQTNDIAYIGVRMLVNKDTSSEYEVTKIGLFAYNGTAWSLIEDTYGTIIPGAFKDPAYAASVPATTAERRIVKTCLVEVVNEELESSDHSPRTLMDLLFGTGSENELCDVWKEISTGSLIKENLLVKETIGEDLIDLLNGDPMCVSDGGSKPGPHSLKELLFGSMSTEEICGSFKNLNGDSMFGEITNITSYLGDSYKKYVTNNTYIQTGDAEKPVDPSLNPLAVMAKMDRGQVLYGAGLNEKKEPSYKADYIVDTGYICDTMQEAMDTINSLTDQERIFNTYQRTAYTGIGTAFTPGTASTSIDASDTIYYYNGSIPFADSATCFNILKGNTAWPDPTDSTKLQYVNLGAKTTNNAALATPNLQIYNTCEGRNYILLENSLGTESCPNVRNGASSSTIGMVCVRGNPDWSPSYNEDKIIKTWNEHVLVNGAVQNRRVFAVSNWEFTTSAAWKVKHDGVVSYNASSKTWTFYQAGSTVPSGTKVYASIIFFVEREPNDSGVVATYTNGKLTKVAFTKYRFTSYEYYWNVAVLPRWYNNNYYSYNEYRNHFVYTKRYMFAKSPSYLSGLGIQEQVYSSGNPTDSLSWVYDSGKKLIFLGCNSVVWTGFLSNKKFPKYHFETSPNSDTDDDDGTGIIMGGYKDNETGIIHTLSLTRSYSSETSFECCLDRGYGGIQLFNINATANTFDNNPNLKVRHLNGRYGGYFKNGTQEFVPVTYDGSYGIACDPKTSTSNGTEPEGYYATSYATDKVGSIYNITKTIYRDVYVNTGPSSGYNISFKMGTANEVVYSGTTYTTTKNGRRKLDDNTNEMTTTEATNNWIDVKKVIQAVLGIVAQGGLIFGRTACTSDKELGRGTITNVLDVQHVFPFHKSGVSFDTWWGSIGQVTKDGITNSIRYSFKKGSNSDITANEALTVLKAIYPKYELSSLTYSQLTVDDLFKLYHGGSRLYAGDPQKDCFAAGNLTTLGFIQGYGYLNAYTKKNLNSKYIVDKTPNKLIIVYKDLFYNVAGGSTTDSGIQYLKDKHPYRGDITITFEVVDDTVVNLTVHQGTTTVRATSDQTRASSTVKHLPNLGDPRLLKMLKESSGYGYTGCSNPLTNFTENVFLDLNTSTVYDLDTNHIWIIDETANTYTETQADATAAIYKKYGPGKLISNDISEKLYYTRGDSDHVQKLVDGSIGGSSSGGSIANLSSYYNIIKSDILAEVDRKLYGSEGREGDVDADGNEIAGEDAVQGLAALIRSEVQSQVNSNLIYGDPIVIDATKLTDIDGNPATSNDSAYFTITGCTPGKMLIVGHANAEGKATSCGIRVVSGSLIGFGDHTTAFYRLGTTNVSFKTVELTHNTDEPQTIPNGVVGERLLDYSMSFVIIPTSTEVKFEVMDLIDDSDILYIYK